MRSALFIVILLVGVLIVGWVWIGRNPRDSALRRTVKQAVLLIALLAIGLSFGSYLARNSARDSPAGRVTSRSGLLGENYYVRQVEVEDGALFADLGLDAHRFEVSAPPDAKVMLWIETYRDGELVADLSWGMQRVPGAGERVREVVRFTRFDPAGVSEPTGDGARAKWTLGFEGAVEGRWVDDPFKRHGGGRIWDHEPVQDVRVGRTYRIFSMIGYEGSGFIGSEGAVKESPVALMVKCRVEPVDAERGDAVGYFPVEVPPTGGSTSAQ